MLVLHAIKQGGHYAPRRGVVRKVGIGSGKAGDPVPGPAAAKPQDQKEVCRARPGTFPNPKLNEEEKMKKLLIGFLAVGLIMGFAMTASAQPNIKASGTYYVYGSYADNQSLTKDTGQSRANVAQRLRMQFEIQIQEGLKLTTRFDAMERVWGQQPTIPTTNIRQTAAGAAIDSRDVPYDRFENNISWERVYVTFNALYGVWDVGYQQTLAWGTCAFCNDYTSDAAVHYRYMMGPWTFGLEWEKPTGFAGSNTYYGLAEGSRSSGSTSLSGTDDDHDVYHVYAIYRWATGQAGIRYEFDRDATNGKQLTGSQTAILTAPYGGTTAAYTGQPWVSTFHELAPYVQWVSGPFALEAEFRYIWGTTDYDGALSDIDRKGWDLYLNGKYTMGAFYGGLEFCYISGDDPATTDKNEAGVLGGDGWDPLLMFGNNLFHKWHGTMGPAGAWYSNGGGGSTTTAGVNSIERNLMMIKPYVGYKVNPQLEIVAQYAWLKANETSAGMDDEYGKEFDIYATYKIYNNLSYTVGFGYFWTGDYFKDIGGTVTNVDDNFLLMNQLTLSF